MCEFSTNFSVLLEKIVAHAVVHPISNPCDLKEKVAETPQESAEEIQTYARYSGLLKLDVVECDVEVPEFNVSYKRMRRSVQNVMKPLQIEQLMDQEVVNLSGGELRRVALYLCLGKFLTLLISGLPNCSPGNMHYHCHVGVLVIGGVEH
ncbi:hypothetical protein Syun_029923 [Stephania yunnanensis]|uniref:ABC transporter domain-containing protein n=1 Tax=Stephania yunnanensis TaxID=152371 RepID=A0AAP0E6H9_9MAGN